MWLVQTQSQLSASAILLNSRNPSLAVSAGRSVVVAALGAAALLVAGATDAAQAQLFQWGTWGGPSAWDPPRRPRRAIPRNVPDDGEKIVSTLPKPTGPLVLVVSL